MDCPKCSFEQADRNIECAKCGIIFEKFRTIQTIPQQSVSKASQKSTEHQSAWEIVKYFLLHIESEVNGLLLTGRIFVFALLFIWGCRFIFSSVESNFAGESFLHLVNLPFHEAGHIICIPFGKFIQTLGGTFGQLMMPVICLIGFLIKTRDPFGGSVALWWFGQNFMDIAPYINDARALKLTLLGGVTGRETVDYHDWEYILRKMGWLKWDHTIASMSKGIGVFLMLASFAWGGYILYLQYQKVRTKSKL